MKEAEELLLMLHASRQEVMELLNKSGKYSKKFEAFTGKLACLDFVDDLDDEMFLFCLCECH